MKAPRGRADRERLALAAGLTAVLTVCGAAILDPDLPWHLSAARHMWETGAVPRSDFLSWTMAGKPWIDFEWGAELIFAGLQHLGGPSALWIFRSAALFGVVLLFLSLLRLWKLPPKWGAIGAPALAAALFPMYGLRPEIFSTLLFMTQLHLLERRRLGAPRLSPAAFVAVHAVLYAAWANLHAGFPMGLLLCACYGVGELIERRDRVPVPLLAAAAGFAGTFVNPYGAEIYSVLLDHWRHMTLLRSIIIEWTPPNFTQRYLAGYWILLAFSFAGFLLASGRGVSLPPAHVAAVVVFGFLASRSIRTTPYIMLLIYPFGLKTWSRLQLTARQLRALSLPALLAVPFAAWCGFGWARRLRFFVWPSPTMAQGPDRTFAFLAREKAVLSGLKLYNPYNWGGALGYALYPDYKVYIDGRYIFADMLSEIYEAQRDPENWRAYMDAHGVQLVVSENVGLLLSYPSQPVGRPYSVYAWPRADWALVYWDADAIVVVRRQAVPARWLAEHEYRWIRPFDLHEASLYLTAGVVPLKSVEAEVERYRREIGDARETAILTAWLDGFKTSAGK